MGEVTLDSVTKVFDDDSGEVVAVDDLDLTIEDGEFLVLVGPSGCGKSTTLRCISGLEAVTDGRIRLDGEDVTYRRPKNRNMAMVFQNYALYPHMTARENMAFSLEMGTEMSDDEIAERVEEVGSMTGIGALLDKQPGELSGGQQQRVALGRAIVRNPEVFLMDEPLSNLDAKLRADMRTELQNLQEEFGVTTIYVTHDQTEAMTMGDRIAILDEGDLQQVGSPLECYYRPTNVFVAGFIGSPSMNFFYGKLTERNDDYVIRFDEFDYALSAETVEELTPDVGPGDQVTLGIRPEDVRLADDGEENVVEARVDVVEPLGEVNYIHLAIGPGSYTGSFDGRTLFSEGETLVLTFPEQFVHVFDGETGTSVKAVTKPSEHGDPSRHVRSSRVRGPE
jgi:multiple sugar transport system ATP-binding protein